MSTTLEYTAAVVQELADSSIDRQEWLARGRELAQADSALTQQFETRQFAVGDWLTEGEERWSREAYGEASAIFTGYARATLHTFASVARSVKPLSRDKRLSWAHHKAVARFDKRPDLQRELLAHAAEEGLSLSTFRKHIEEKYPPVRPVRKPERAIKLVLPADVRTAVECRAREWGKPVENVICDLIERALRYQASGKRQSPRPRKRRDGDAAIGMCAARRSQP